jgi:hypothetical protein
MKRPDDDDKPASTYFELQRRRSANPGEEPPADRVPPLPLSSPWHHDPCGDEPHVDRTEDGDFTDMTKE